MKKHWAFRVWGFIAAIYFVSGILWVPILLSGEGTDSAINMILMALIAFVPSMMGILFTYLVKESQERRDFWRRNYHWPDAKPPLIIAGLLILPALNISAYILSCTFSGQPISMEYARQLVTSIPILLQFLVVEITFGAISEELGWRGYLLGEMQNRWNALHSALVLGVFWGLWHTPTFIVPGLAQHEMNGIFSPAYWSFVLTAVMISVLQTWLFNNTERSTLVAGIIMHFLANASLVMMAGIFDKYSMPEVYWWVSILLYCLATAFIVILFGPKTLARKLPWLKQQDKARSTTLQMSSTLNES